MGLNKHGEITSCLLYTIFSRQQHFSHLGECIFKQYRFFFHSSLLSSLLKKPVLELSLVLKLVCLYMDFFSVGIFFCFDFDFFVVLFVCLFIVFLNNLVFIEFMCWTVITKILYFCGSAPCRNCNFWLLPSDSWRDL